MKKVYTILCGAFLAALLVVGAVSVFRIPKENAPKLRFSSLMNGSYGAEKRTQYAGAFSKSAGLTATNKHLNSFYKFSGLSGKDDAQLIIGMDGNAANHGAALPDNSQKPEPSSSQLPSSEPSSSAPSESSSETTESVEPSSYVDPDATQENLGSAVLIGDRAVEVPYADYDKLADYADAVTAISNALGSQIRTFGLVVPNGAEFYTTEDYHSGNSSQLNMIDYIYQHVGSNVKTVDAYSKLTSHIEEYIYFRTDHHWTQLGAYYAYTAFCEAAGFEAEPLSKFETGEKQDFVGSMYGFLSNYPQAQVLRENPDTLYYYEPYVEAHAKYYSDATLTDGIAIGVISSVPNDPSMQYLCFLGGDHPITVITTDVPNGKTCLLLKESYGNAFAPWLTSHYSKIIAIDPREFNRDGYPSLDLAAFAREQGVNDCIVLDYPMVLSNEAYIEWMNRLVANSAQ